MILVCEQCGQNARVRPYRIKTFKFCSLRCKHASMQDRIPWNKGATYDEGMKKKLNTAGLALGRGLFKGVLLKPSYPNTHYWVRTHKGRASHCSVCQKTKGHFEWANIDHHYRPILDEYVSLCKKCHVQYDFDHKLIDKEKRYRK